MPILSGDIKFLASKVMTDDPEGGGGPVGTVIPDGANNAVFQDVTEFDRSGGAVSVRQLILAVQTSGIETFQDANVIVSRVPNDANVSVTLAKCGMFSRRTDIANSIENYLIQGPEWGGYLLENHVVGQRSIQLLQRPGTPTPPIGRTLVLIYNEDLGTERKQYVRVTRVEVEKRTFTYQTNGGYVDYPADVVTCDISDALRFSFPGSPPERGYARNVLKTVLRDTTVADAATYYGASPLTAIATLGDSSLRVSSVYSQLVPSARTESAALDQRPAAQRQLTLATSPRTITVGAAPHTQRTRVGQENRGFAWVNILKPFPAPNSVVISWMALGVWYTLVDDGIGGLTGSGVGTVNYANGSISLTLPALPDVGSSIIYSWGEKSAYTNQSGNAGFRNPEFAWSTPQAPVKPGSVVVTWMSGAVLKTATDNGSGGFTSAAASGEIDYATGKIYLRPTAMLDAGGEFQTAFEYSSAITQNFAGIAPDAGGFASLVLDAVPAPKSLKVQWITTRNVSASSGSSDIVSSTGGTAAVAISPPRSGSQHQARISSAGGANHAPGTTLLLEFKTQDPSYGTRTYEWSLLATRSNAVPTDATPVLVGGAVSGRFTVAASAGGSNHVAGVVIPLDISATCPELLIYFTLEAVGFPGVIAATQKVFVTPAQSDFAYPVVVPVPAIQTREPIKTGGQFLNPYAQSQVIVGMYVGGVDTSGAFVHIAVPPSFSETFGAYYDPPDSMTEVWTVAQVVEGKLLKSQMGITNTYKVWK